MKIQLKPSVGAVEGWGDRLGESVLQIFPGDPTLSKITPVDYFLSNWQCLLRLEIFRWGHSSRLNNEMALSGVED